MNMQYNESDVYIQQAKPDQAKLAAPLIYDTDPALFDYLFIDGYEVALEYFEKEWRQKQSIHSFSLCSVAMKEDTLVGIELGYNRKTEQEYKPHTGKTGISSLTPEGTETLIDRDSYSQHLFPPIPDDAYYILFLSTHNTIRDQGLGSRLLANAYDKARKRGYRTCELDVASDSKAVGFYLKMEMNILSETRVIPLEEYKIPSHYRMVKEL